MKSDLPKPKTVPLFGLNLSDQTLAEAAEYIFTMISAGDKHTVHFVNAHCVNVAARDKNYYDVLRASDVLYADGSGMRMTARMTSMSFRDNVNGTDLFPCLCYLAAQRNIGIGLLGAKPGVAKEAADKLRHQFPGLSIPFVHDGYFEGKDIGRILENIKTAGIGILLVAMGVPKQELFIHRFRQQLDVPVAMGVGALFDFYSGRFRRAPLWMRNAGMEWFFRLLLEPRRLAGRYLVGNVMFLVRALIRRAQGCRVLQYKPVS
jgi:N-acetylglucosaminyldiphosphoundecaprenol N-acetyl-beta-D-mannosaminyltransferase